MKIKLRPFVVTVSLTLGIFSCSKVQDTEFWNDNALDTNSTAYSPFVGLSSVIEEKKSSSIETSNSSNSSTGLSSSSSILSSNSSTRLSSSSSILISSSATSSSSSARELTYDGNIWSLNTHGENLSQIKPSVAATGGSWYSYSDADYSNGNSSVQPLSGDFDLNISSNNAIKAEFVNKSLYKSPYSGIGFHWNAIDNQEGPFLGTPINLWQAGYSDSLCVVYTTTNPMDLVLDWDGSMYGWSSYQVTLPIQLSPSIKKYALTDFKTAIASTQVGTLDTAIQKSTGLRFQFDGLAGTSATFTLYAVGAKDSCSIQ